mgnify:CR=1 FL=1
MASDTTVLSKVSSFIDSRLDTVKTWASKANSAADAAISGVGTFKTPTITISAPETPTIASPGAAPQTDSVPDQTISNSPKAAGFTVVDSLTQQDKATVSAPTYGTAVDAQDMPKYALPKFEAKFTNLSKPTTPTAPTSNFPEQPKVDLPVRPTMESLKIDNYDFPNLEAFTESLPHYDISADRSKLEDNISQYDNIYKNWIDKFKEAEKNLHKDKLVDLYKPKSPPQPAKKPVPTDEQLAIEVQPSDRKDLIRDVVSQAQKTVVKYEVQDVVDKIDREYISAVKQAINKYSSQNFPFFGGPVAGEIVDIHVDASIKMQESYDQAVSRMNEKIFKDWNLYLKFTAEVEHHAQDFLMFEAQQRLDIEKLRVSSQEKMFDATVQLYNMEQDARRSYIDAYKAELEGRLRVLETYQPLIEAGVAKTAENDVQLQMYTADVGNQKTAADLYTAHLKTLAYDIKVYNEKVRALKAESDTAATNIEAYREAVKAYAASVEASGTSIKSFTEQVQAESSIVDVSNANVQAYAEYMQQTAKQFELDKAFASGHGDLLRANISAYQSAVQVEESRVRALIAAIEGKADIASAKASALSSVIPAYSAYNRATAAKAEANRAYALAAAENAAQAAALTAMATAATDKVNAGATAAKAVAAAALAQGAMSAMYVSKSVQGAISQSSSASKDSGVAETFGAYDTAADTYRKSLSG